MQPRSRGFSLTNEVVFRGVVLGEEGGGGVILLLETTEWEVNFCFDKKLLEIVIN